MASNRETKKKISQLFKRNLKQVIRETAKNDFTSCADLPLINFIKITITGDLKWLGNCADPEKLWEAIHSEYTELSGDAQSNRGLELAKQITFLVNKINITNSIVEYLSLRGNIPELVKELQNMGYRLAFTNLEADLRRVISLSKSDHVKLAAAKSAYEKIENGEKTTEFMWYKMLSAIAKHRQVVSINPALITVVEYLAMDKEFREYCEMMSKINI